MTAPRSPALPRPLHLAVLLVGLGLALGPAGHAAHPTGAVQESKAQLTRSGLRGDLTEISCLDCHVPHGATVPGMLTAESLTDGCLSCHTGMSRKPASGTHPWDARTPAAAVRQAKQAGAVFGPDDTLTCLSCHTAHGEASPTGTCASCHGGEARGGAHDKVACLDCHLVHPGVGNQARRTPAAGDPDGCLSCHAAGRSAATTGVSPGRLGHPVAGATLDNGKALTCRECHEPHGPPVQASVQGCGECHADQRAATQRGGHGDATCMDCHPVHASSPMQQVRSGVPTDLNPRSRACLACHGPGGSAKIVEAFDHPSPVFDLNGKRWKPLGNVPLYAKDGTPLAAGVNGDLTCSSCHLTHGPDADTKDSLRREGWQPACSSCHGDDALPLYRYFHQPERRAHIKP